MPDAVASPSGFLSASEPKLWRAFSNPVEDSFLVGGYDNQLSNKVTIPSGLPPYLINMIVDALVVGS